MTLQSARYVICAIDATCWQGDIIVDGLSKLSTVVSMSICNIGHIQYPLLHAATTLSATVKHTRRIQDTLLSAELDFSTNVTLTYSRDGSVRQSSDKQPVTQSCVVVMSTKPENKWADSECIQSGVIGPLPVISVSEMQGYDPENKPAPGQRASQNFGMPRCSFLNR